MGNGLLDHGDGSVDLEHLTDRHQTTHLASVADAVVSNAAGAGA